MNGKIGLILILETLMNKDPKWGEIWLVNLDPTIGVEIKKNSASNSY